MAKFNPTACSVLGFLHMGSMSGWDIGEAMQDTIGYFWSATRSQIYRELRTLEEHELVVGGDRGLRDRRTYEITEAGRAVFREWISREPAPESFRFPLLLTLWFGEHLGAEELEWFLRLNRAKHTKQMARYEKLRDELPESGAGAYRRHVLDFAVDYERTLVDWINRLPWLADDKAGGSSSRSTKGARGKG